MRRRQVLALAAVGFAGCLSDSVPGANGTDDGTTRTPDATNATDTPTETPTPTATDRPTDTETPMAPNIDSYPGDCPTYDAPRVVCSDAAPDDAPLRMTPSDASVDLPAELEFTLRNDTDAEFHTNHYAARLHKRVDGEWFHVAPNGWPEPLMMMPPGESHTWTVALARDPDADASGGGGSGGGETERTVGGLGGGRYAFGNVGWFADEGHEERIAVVAAFEVEGPPVELTVTDDVSDVSVDGETVAARWTGDRGEGGKEATFVLRRTDAQADRRLVAEQVVQPGVTAGAPLRDALALAVDHDAETVRLTGPTSVSPPFGVTEPTVVEYEGQSYELSADGAE